MIEALANPPGAEQTALVGHQGFDLEGAARRVDRRVDPRDLALDGARPGCARVESRTRWPTRTSSAVLLGNLAPEADRVFDHELGDRFTFLDHLPFGDLPLGDAIRKRRWCG